MPPNTCLPVVAVIAPGAMGAAVSKRLSLNGLSILTSPLSTRSSQSQSRAKDARMIPTPLALIASKAHIVLSILPPGQAYSFAQSFRDVHASLPDIDRQHTLVFADCNAVNPISVKRIAAIFDNSPNITFIDASIIGFPPNDNGYNPTFYASAAPADTSALDQFEVLANFGLQVRTLRGQGAGIGDASALKMSYAGIMKAITGLTTTMILAANASSPATSTALLHELASSQPDLLKRTTIAIPDMLPKAYRWVNEMDEISAFVAHGFHPSEDDKPQPGHEGPELIHRGLARLFDSIEHSQAGDGKDVNVLLKFVEDSKRLIDPSP